MRLINIKPILPTYLNFMPVSIMQIISDGYNLCASSQIISQPQRAIDKFQLKEVVRPSVVGIEQQTVGLVSFELEFEGPVEAGVPLTELRVRVLLVEHERERAWQRQREEEQQQAAHRGDVTAHATTTRHHATLDLWVHLFRFISWGPVTTENLILDKYFKFY